MKAGEPLTLFEIERIVSFEDPGLVSLRITYPKEAGVEVVMGAYNRTNGEPCCGSKALLRISSANK